MSQHDLDIANQGFPATRADLNNALQALGSTNSGATAPSTTYANQLWYDTANNILKIRNEDNDAWISVLYLDQTNDAVTQFDVDNIRIDGNTISSTDTNGDITLDPNGTGDVSVPSGSVGIGTTTNNSSGATKSVAINAATGMSAYEMRTGDVFTGYLGNDNTDMYLVNAKNGSLEFYTNNTERGRFLAGGGLTFNGDTAAANALDDYEEGTWTPVVQINNSTTGITYNSQEGAYTKVGRLVTLIAAIHLSSKGSNAGAVKVSGLPFTVGDQLSTTSFNGFASVYWGGLATTTSQLQGWLDDGSTEILMRHVDGSGNVSVQGFTDTDINNSSDFRFFIQYFV